MKNCVLVFLLQNQGYVQLILTHAQYEKWAAPIDNNNLRWAYNRNVQSVPASLVSLCALQLTSSSVTFCLCLIPLVQL